MLEFFENTYQNTPLQLVLKSSFEAKDRELLQTSEVFEKIFNRFHVLTLSKKNSFLDSNWGIRSTSTQVFHFLKSRLTSDTFCCSLFVKENFICCSFHSSITLKKGATLNMTFGPKRGFSISDQVRKKLVSHINFYPG